MTLDMGSPGNQNSFVDVLHSEIVAGSENLAAWIRDLNLRGGIDDLFGLETWLKGIRAYFNPEHLPLRETERAEIVNRSFASEIRVIRQALQKCESYASAVLGSGRGDKPEFEEFIAFQMRKDRILDFHVSRIVEQLTPVDSIAQMLEYLNDSRILIDALRNQPGLGYQVYLGLGRSYSRELRNCRYLDMLLSQRFRLQYDFIDSRPLTGVIRSIPEPQNRRNLALAFLYLFRFTKYLSIIAAHLEKDQPLRKDIIIFSLLHEEMNSFSEFLKNRILKPRESSRSLRNAAELISYSLKTESRRVLGQELALVARESDPTVIYARVENSHGLLLNCCQSCVVTLVHAIDSTFDPSVLFPSRAERLIAAETLRQSLWTLRQWLVDILANRQDLNSSRIIEYLTSFRDTSLQSLMYRDWAEFEAFLDILTVSSSFIEIRTQMRKFVNFLEALIQEVSKRSVFQDNQDPAR